MKTLRLALVAAVAGTLGFCSAGAPAFAAPTKVAHPKPKPPEKIERIKRGEVIIRVPGGFDPELKYRRVSPDSPDYLKDPYVWA